MATIASCSPSVSPHSPAKKKTKFSLRLKGKNKPKKEEIEDEQPKLHPMFSPVEISPDRAAMAQPPAFVGLKNRSNLCYANAVLQVLRKCPGFVTFVDDLEKQVTVKLKEAKADKRSDSTEGTSPKDRTLPVMISQLNQLLNEMNEIQEDFIENKKNCQHLIDRGGSLVLAAEPCDFMEAFRHIHSTFENHLQHDAQEFLRTLIISLHEVSTDTKTTTKSCDSKVAMSTPKSTVRKQLVLEKNGKLTTKEVPRKESNVIEDLFQGRLVHETKCLTCENAKQRFEDFQDVSVPVHEDQQNIEAKKKLMLSPTPKKDKSVKKHTLEWAMSQFATVECLQGDNKYFCENCCTHTEARLSTCFDQLPEVLTIHLKRFTSVYSGFSPGFVSKITSNLETPLRLSIEEWCSEKCRHQSTMYELFGIVLHSGMTSCSGHYQAYVKVQDSQGKMKGMEKRRLLNGESLRNVQDSQQEETSLDKAKAGKNGEEPGEISDFGEQSYIDGTGRNGTTAKGSLSTEGSKKPESVNKLNRSECKEDVFVGKEAMGNGIESTVSGQANLQDGEPLKRAKGATTRAGKRGGQDMANEKRDNDSKACQDNGEVTAEVIPGNKGKGEKSKVTRKSLRRSAKGRRGSDANTSNSSTDLDEDELTNSNAAKRARLDPAVPSPDSNIHEETSPGTDNTKTPGHVTCSFGLTNITKFFHKSRKKSSKVKNVEVENSCSQTEMSKTNGAFECKENNIDQKSSSSLTDDDTKCKGGSTSLSDRKGKENYPRKESSTTESPIRVPRNPCKSAKLPKSPAIRQLTFQVNEHGLAVCDRTPERKAETTPQKSEQTLDANNNQNKGIDVVEETPKSSGPEWVHFDDSEVHMLDDADVAALLSSAESSFTSPYLLFYTRC